MKGACGMPLELVRGAVRDAAVGLSMVLILLIALAHQRLLAHLLEGMEKHTYSTDDVGLEFKKVKVIPEGECLITDPLSISVDFTSKVQKEDVEVELQFVADCSSKKIATKLASCTQNINVGTNSVSFNDVPNTLPQSIDKNVLANIGLTSITFRTKEQLELARITMVTDVKLNADNFYRIVYNPLE